MRERAFSFAILIAVHLSTLPMQGFGQGTTTSFHPLDWGITDLRALRSGQLSLILEDGGPRVVVHELSSEEIRHDFDPSAVRRATPEIPGGELLVSGFRRGNRNSLGGSFSAFALPPARGTAGLAWAPDGTRALHIECTGAESAFCGAWVHLFDPDPLPEERTFLDARPFEALTFELRADNIGEGWTLKVADAAWESREDAPPAGLLRDLARPTPRAHAWTQVTLRLSDLNLSVDRTALASIIFQGPNSEHAELYIRNLKFVTSLASARVSGSLGSDESERVTTGGVVAQTEVAVWLWSTEALLADPSKARQAIRFLEDQSIDAVFLQIPDGPVHRRGSGERILEATRLSPLLAALNGAGVRVYALDGAPEFAEPDYHEGVVQTVRNVAAYNAAVLPQQRFYGVRYDIEPYLLPGFHGPRQETILLNLLSLVDRLATVANEAGLTVGLDIPFWYDQRNERSLERVEVEWRGKRQPMSYHLIELVDDLSIMAYRTAAYGADGVIMHSEDELRFAESVGKGVFVGLETRPLPNEMLLQFSGRPRLGLPKTPPDSDRLVFIPRADSTLVMLQLEGSGAPLDDWTAAERWLAASAIWWPVSRRISVPARKLTFAEEGSDRLTGVLEDVERELWGYASFRGFAIHDLVGWSELLRDGVRGR